jgi:hypothetical protein
MDEKNSPVFKEIHLDAELLTEDSFECQNRSPFAELLMTASQSCEWLYIKDCNFDFSYL